MSQLDWFVLIFTLLFIVIYGVWKTRGSKDLKSYLKDIIALQESQLCT